MNVEIQFKFEFKNYLIYNPNLEKNYVSRFMKENLWHF